MLNQPQIELGIVLYPCVQMATVLGLTDLFDIAGRYDDAEGEPRRPPLRISHWQLGETGQAPKRVHDSHPDASCAPSMLILRMRLGIPSCVTKPVATYAAAAPQSHLPAASAGA